MRTYIYFFAGWTVLAFAILGVAIRYALVKYVTCKKCGRRLLESQAWSTSLHPTAPKPREEPVEWYCESCL